MDTYISNRILLDRLTNEAHLLQQTPFNLQAAFAAMISTTYSILFWREFAYAENLKH